MIEKIENRFKMLEHHEATEPSDGQSLLQKLQAENLRLQAIVAELIFRNQQLRERSQTGLSA